MTPDMHKTHPAPAFIPCMHFQPNREQKTARTCALSARLKLSLSLVCQNVPVGPGRAEVVRRGSCSRVARRTRGSLVAAKHQRREQKGGDITGMPGMMHGARE